MSFLHSQLISHYVIVAQSNLYNMMRTHQQITVCTNILLGWFNDVRHVCVPHKYISNDTDMRKISSYARLTHSTLFSDGSF